MSQMLTSWRDQAACKGLTNLFYTERGEPSVQAKRVCARCPVQAECREAGMAEHFGIWGGLSEQERRQERRKILDETGVLLVEPPPLTLRCGEPAGYRGHLRRGEIPCVECKKAHSIRVQLVREAKRIAADTSVMDGLRAQARAESVALRLVPALDVSA